MRKTQRNLFSLSNSETSKNALKIVAKVERAWRILRHLLKTKSFNRLKRNLDEAFGIVGKLETKNEALRM